MRRLLGSSLARCLPLICLGLPASVQAERLPEGAPLEIRLRQPISSYATRPGTRISGVLVAPVGQGGRILVPLGTTVEGSVVSARRVGLGVMHETAELGLEFDRLVLADGRAVPIACRVTSVENAREGINKEGRIQGIWSTSTLSSKISGLVGSLAFGDPIAAIFTTAGTASVLRFSEPEIALPAGSELEARLTAPVDLPPGETESIPTIATSERERQELASMVRRLPFRTHTQGKRPVPSDLTNLVFLGSAEGLQRAFAASGWVIADTLSAQTTYNTVRSIAENQGYQAAPMSVLTLDGREPDFAYEKTLNTFSKRHHLRMWRMAETWHGRPVWTSSATHDIGIGFSRKNKTFIHLIDTHIDNERAKVVNDLIYTGCVTEAQLVTRPWLPQDAKNGTGEELITDDRIAVLTLNDCSHPVDAAGGGEEGTPDPPVHGNLAERVTRQTVLTLKNNIVRDNAAVRGYSTFRQWTGRRKKEEEPQERTMVIGGEAYTIDSVYRPSDGYEPIAGSTHTSPGTGIGGGDGWVAPTVELGARIGYHGYYGGDGGAIAFLLTQDNMPETEMTAVLGNTLHDGWTFGGTVTVDKERYLSHELSYEQSFTHLKIGLSAIGSETTSGLVVDEFAFDRTGLRTSQFAYNLLVNARPKTARLRPYLAVGPSLQLMHLSEAPIKKAPGWFMLGLSNVGLIGAAYNFGSTPPLEGGGIFQPGLNYGGGARYRLTPQWMIRADYRETLVSQPDFWTRSIPEILTRVYADEGWTLALQGPDLKGAMRQGRFTGGVSFTF